MKNTDSLLDHEYCPPLILKEGNEEDTDGDNFAIKLKRMWHLPD